MHDLDERIRKTLRHGDEVDLPAAGDDPALLELVVQTFRGRQRWLVALASFWILVFFVLGIYTAVRFFQAEAVKELLQWAMGFWFSMTAVAMLKTWYFLQLGRVSLLREIKRLELQVARLAAAR